MGGDKSKKNKAIICFLEKILKTTGNSIKVQLADDDKIYRKLCFLLKKKIQLFLQALFSADCFCLLELDNQIGILKLSLLPSTKSFARGLGPLEKTDFPGPVVRRLWPCIVN